VIRQAALAVEAGVDVIQVRERDLSASALAALVRACVSVARGSATRVIVNDRLDVALSCGAAGVHLRSDSLPPEIVRRLAPTLVIGRSVHSAEEAEHLGTTVDYLIAGTIWPTSSKPPAAPLLGVEGLAGIVAKAKVPVMGIGGVSIANAGQAAAAGASGVAAIGLFVGKDADASGCRIADLGEQVRRLRASFDTPRQAS
jgi:thiamine-phosphate pyrophosphorylase